MEKFHIVIIRFSSLGDVVLTSSMVSFLRQVWGDKVFISYLTSIPFHSLLESHPAIDKTYGLPRERGWRALLQLKAFVKDIERERRIDLLLDLHGTLRSLFIRLTFPHIPRLSVDKRTLERWILTTFKMDFLSSQGPKGRRKGYGELLLHRNVRDFAGVFHASFSPVKLSNFVEKLSCSLNYLNQDQVSSSTLTFREATSFHFEKWNLPYLEKSSFICFVPTASFPEKRWPAEKFKKLMEMCLLHDNFQEQKFIVLAGSQDKFCDLFNELQVRFPGRFYNLQGKTDLLESTFFLKKSFFCVGNDTGLPHLAESVGTPSLFILGPTGEEFGFYPHLKDSRVVSVSLWCRPCTTNGKGNCIRSQRFCLTNITEEMVLKKMFEMKKSLSSENERQNEEQEMNERREER